jgi:hypothetical protein
MGEFHVGNLPLLPKDRSDLNFNGAPAFEYAYPVLPSSVITRFIIRMNQKIENHFVWRTGVALKIVKNIYIGGDVKGGTIIAGDDNEVKK